ncbi:hypothetical protein AB0I72_11345 [Nocardiopsis sp. NPDC049922]|uniref:hypothetical protein n=1 Tax=Nocardiopsis sp. NPDC049922 TaxID=3155157 RepID=UPI0033D70E71
MTIQPTLIEGLRAWADGFAADRAAVELLITHGAWLSRADFLTRCVDIVPTEELIDPDTPVAIIDWERVIRYLEGWEGGLPASSSEVAVLAVAASIGAGHPVDLRDALLGLDATNTAAVATALVTAAQVEDRVTVDLKPRQLPDWLTSDT